MSSVIKGKLSRTSYDSDSGVSGKTDDTQLDYTPHGLGSDPVQSIRGFIFSKSIPIGFDVSYDTYSSSGARVVSCRVVSCRRAWRCVKQQDDSAYTCEMTLRRYLE